MKSAKDPRHIARIIAIMDLYHYFFQLGNEAQAEYNFEELEIGNYSKKLQEFLVEGVKSNVAEIDKLINTYSEPIKSTDLDLLILNIVRSCIYEGFIAKSVPPKVAVDEAIELTRDFGVESASKKVSGIIGRIFDNTVKKEEAKEDEKTKKQENNKTNL